GFALRVGARHARSGARPAVTRGQRTAGDRLFHSALRRVGADETPGAWGQPVGMAASLRSGTGWWGAGRIRSAEVGASFRPAGEPGRGRARSRPQEGTAGTGEAAGTRAP